MSKLIPCRTSTRFRVGLTGASSLSSVQLLHSGADPIRIDPLPPAGLAGALDQDEAHPLGSRLLVALERRDHGLGLDGAVERGRKVARREQLGDPRAELGGA